MTAEQIELRVKSIWMELLNKEDIDPTQNFFELGGDSLMMIDMLFRLGADIQRDIDPGLIFQDATLQGFSRLIASSPEVMTNSSQSI